MPLFFLHLKNIICKNIFLLTPLFLVTYIFSQQLVPSTTSKEQSKKGTFYIYWGWNRSLYTNSDISFKGPNYDFTLEKVAASDRPSPLSAEVYLNPGNFTIPQYNFRIGYFMNDNYSVSFGADHMKYVITTHQHVKINGAISNSGTAYDGNYSNSDLYLTPQFLLFEHTDGLNYFNIELRRHHQLYQRNNTNVNLTGGAGGGIIVPRTNTTLLGNPRYDQFHLAGYGLSAIAAINLTYKRFFLQTEIKGGFIDLPSIRTTMFTEDNAQQNFWFFQSNIVLGALIGPFKCRKTK
jgi:hypothetical protein